MTRFNHDKTAITGALLWMSSIQYFMTQLIVISAWTVPHSFANNFISDLGNTQCGTYAGIAVCSPLHLLMNMSFAVFGITIGLGALLLYASFVRTKITLAAFVLMVLSGIGTIMVGLFPENTTSGLHMIGAALGLGVGNVSVLLLGIGLKHIHPGIRAYTIVSALVSLSAFASFAAELHAGLGRGGMERLISYPFAVWMIMFGSYVLAVRIRARHSR